MSQINASGYFENTLIRTNISPLYKQHHRSKICLQELLGLNNLTYDYFCSRVGYLSLESFVNISYSDDVAYKETKR